MIKLLVLDMSIYWDLLLVSLAKRLHSTPAFRILLANRTNESASKGCLSVLICESGIRTNQTTKTKLVFRNFMPAS